MLANMISRGGATPLVRTGFQGLKQAQEVQSRNVATLKTLQQRMRSIKNMQKITKAMKMVAAAKMRKDTRAMEMGMPFTLPAINLLRRLGSEEKPGPITYLAITSDKGLCGGVNSAVNKQIRLGVMTEEAKGNPASIMIMGGKGVAGLKRVFGDRFSYSFEELSKVPFTFGAASVIAAKLVATNPVRLKIVSNEFKSMVVYNTNVASTLTLDEVKTMDKLEFSKAMDNFNFEPSGVEMWNDLHEFYYASVIYGAFLQSACTETAQRMSAMENASKNAGEMYDKVSLQFNRARQAKITTELCEIISGAAAV